RSANLAAHGSGVRAAPGAAAPARSLRAALDGTGSAARPPAGRGGRAVRDGVFAHPRRAAELGYAQSPLRAFTQHAASARRSEPGCPARGPGRARSARIDAGGLDGRVWPNPADGRAVLE